jgi:riboflavin synthase
MFTGLIEGICEVKLARRSAGGVQLTIELGKLAKESKIGDSIAVNGVCLTVTEFDGQLATFDVSSETLSKSTLGRLRPASQVNIERAIKATDRFGGHFVAGHVDGVATIKAIDSHGQFADMKFAVASALLEQMVVKGSVAVDGISLTIADMNENGFSVALIPETLKKTTLGNAKIGDVVNIETDMIVKTIKKQLEKILPKAERLTVEKLKAMGF